MNILFLVMVTRMYPECKRNDCVVEVVITIWYKLIFLITVFMNIDSTFTYKGRDRMPSINSDPSNRINESISKHKYMTWGHLATAIIIFDHKQLQAM